MNCLTANTPVRLLIVFTALTFLNSCAIFKKQTLTSAGDWAFNGKMAIRNADEASSFNVQWLQQGDYYQIILSGPLGQGEMTIKGYPGDVTLTSGKDTYHANNLNQLVYELTEMELPLDHLPYWVRAQADPGIKATISKNDLGQIDSIVQSGWTVSYNDYFKDTDSLPRKLTFEREKNSGKLIIRNWQTKTN